MRHCDSQHDRTQGQADSPMSHPHAQADLSPALPGYGAMASTSPAGEMMAEEEWREAWTGLDA